MEPPSDARDYLQVDGLCLAEEVSPQSTIPLPTSVRNASEDGVQPDTLEKRSDSDPKPTVKTCVEAVGDSSSDSSPSNTRLSYNNGYGDFCFGRVADHLPLWGESDRPLDTKVGSNGVPVPEIGDFLRTGPFEFFKLPFEIRRKIYRLILAPLYRYDSASKTDYIPLFFRDIRTKPPKSYSEMPFPDESDPSREFILKVNAFLGGQYRKRAKHPDRTSKYEIIADARLDLVEESVPRTDYVLLEWLRELSNVSTVLRKELADEFWTNVSLSIQAVGTNFWRLPIMLAERPAIHRGIKRIGFRLPFVDQNRLPLYRAENIMNLCASLSENLQLDYLSITFDADERDLGSFSRGLGDYSPLAALRSLRVTKALDIDCSIDTWNVEHDFDSVLYSNGKYVPGAREDYAQALWVKYKPLVRELILPDTLRAATSTQSEMEKYLSSRPKVPKA